LLEGSNIKEIQDVQQVFGPNPIYSFSSNLPEPYEVKDAHRNYKGENAVLLDGNKLIVIGKDLLNNIHEIITATDSKDQETVLNKLLQEGEMTIKNDNQKRTFACSTQKS
jgi:hypothetical protein